MAIEIVTNIEYGEQGASHVTLAEGSSQRTIPVVGRPVNLADGRVIFGLPHDGRTRLPIVARIEDPKVFQAFASLINHSSESK